MWGSVIFLYDWYLWSGSHFLIFFIMADADILFPSTLGKPKQWVGNLKFVHMIDIYKMAAIFQFVHNDQHWYSISVEMQMFHWFSFLNFPFIQFSLSPYAMPKTFMHGHLCMVTFCTSRKCQKICQNRLTHLFNARVSHLGDSDESPNMASPICMETHHIWIPECNGVTHDTWVSWHDKKMENMYLNNLIGSTL